MAEWARPALAPRPLSGSTPRTPLVGAGRGALLPARRDESRLPHPRLVSAPARSPRAPGLALALAPGRPLPALSPCCRKAVSEAPLRPRADGPWAAGAHGGSADDDTWARGAGFLRKQRSSDNKMGRRSSENGGNTLRVSHISQENLSHWNLDSEVPVPENKSPVLGRESTAGGKINKNHLEIPVEQLILELNLPEHSPRRTQNSKQGPFHLWSYPPKEDSSSENRDFRKASMESGFSISSNPVKLFTLKGLPVSTSVEKPVRSYAGLQIPLGLCWPYADGDFFKDKMESPMALFSAGENSGEALPSPNWDLKHRNSTFEEILTDESDLSENEKANDTLLSYFKKMDLNLKPEKIETVEGSFTEGSSEAFPYPDFLPPPLNTLDLHKLAFSKSESWKATVEPLDSSMDPLITRLLEMERLQHNTVQKEKPRLQTTFCPVITECPASSRAIPKMRQPPKLSDTLTLQTPYVDKSRERRKNNSASCKFEQNPTKWNWSSSGKYKWNTRPSSLKNSSTTKQVMASHDDLKNPKSSTLSPYQETSAKPPTAATAQSLVKMVSTRCLPPRSPVPVSPIPLTFPDHQKEELKVPRTKKKVYRKSIALNRPFYIQKLNCLSPTFIIAKDKSLHIDQK